MNKNRIITMAALISFGTITAANLSKRSPQDTGGLPNSRQWLGLAIVFLMLSAASDLGIESAGGMAVLVMVTVLLARGEDAASYLGVTLNLGKTQPRITNKQMQKPPAPNSTRQGKIPKLQNNPRKLQKPATTQA